MQGQNPRSKNQIPLRVFAVVVAVSLVLRMFVPSRLADPLEILWLFLLCGAYLLTGCRGPRGLRVSFSWSCFLAAAAMTVSTFFSFVIASHMLSTPLRKAAATLLVFCAYFLLFSSLAQRDLTSRFGPQERGQHLRPRTLLALAALFSLIVLLPYRFYAPYGISGDTVSQWDQIHGLVPYNTIHAIGHTIFLKLLLSLWDNYAVVVLFHLLALVCLYLVFADFFYRRGLALPYIALVLSLALIWGFKATDAWYYPWKDTPAALCLCIVTLLAAKYVDAGRLSVPAAALLGFALAWCFLFRLNGIIALVVCGAVFLVSFARRRHFRQLTAALLAMAVSIGGISLYAQTALHPERYQNGFALQLFGSAIAAVVHEDDLSADELQEIDQLLPVDWMQDLYVDARQKRPLLWEQDDSPAIAANPDLSILNNDFVIRMGENKAGVIRLFLRLLPTHFPTMARDILGSMAIIWMQETLFFITNHIFWLVTIVFLAFRKRLPLREWLVFLPCACNAFSIMISTATNEIRYLLPTFMAAPFFVMYLVWRAGPDRLDHTEPSP